MDASEQAALARIWRNILQGMENETQQPALVRCDDSNKQSQTNRMDKRHQGLARLRQLFMCRLRGPPGHNTLREK